MKPFISDFEHAARCAQLAAEATTAELARVFFGMARYYWMRMERVGVVS